MKLGTVPPDPAEFPRLRLLWPPALLLLGARLAEIGGHRWNLHAEGAWLLGAVLVLLVVGTIFSVFSLGTLVPALRQHPSLRTNANLACTGLSLTFVTVSLVYVTVGLLKFFVR